MDYSWSVTTAPVSPNDIPVTVALARQQCRVPDESEDDYLRLLIDAAVNYVQTSGRLILCPQTIRVQWPGFPCGDGFLELPLGPARGTVTLEYVAADALNSRSWTSMCGFQTWADTIPPRLAPAVDTDWPETMPLAVPSVRATYAAGFASATAIPASLRQAVLMLVRTNYESPDGFNKNGAMRIPPVIDQLIGAESRRGYP